MNYTATYNKTQYPFYIQLHKGNIRFTFFLCTLLLTVVKPVHAKYHPGAWLLFWFVMFLVLVPAFVLDLIIMSVGGLFYLLFLKMIVFFKWIGKILDKIIGNTIDVIYKKVIQPILFVGTLTAIVIFFIAAFRNDLFKQLINYVSSLF